jgi:hypothetical protein
MQAYLDKVVYKEKYCEPSLVYKSKDYLEYNACGNSFVIWNFEEKIGVESFSSFNYAELSLDLPKGDFLALTISPLVNYKSGFKYYNEIYTYGKTDANEPENIEYPVFSTFYDFNEINKIGPCWSYSYVSEGNLVYPTIALIIKSGGNYFTYLVNSGNGIFSSLRGNHLVLEGSYTPGKISWNLFIGESYDPYESIRKAFIHMSKWVNVKLREDKKKPLILGKLGWCSWNAFLINLSEEKMINTIEGIVKRGIKLGYALIDDGWQKLNDKKVLDSLDPDEKKFPNGFVNTVKRIKELGINDVGLWHTINLYWSGFSEKVKNYLGEGELKDSSYQLPQEINRVLKAYIRFHKKLKSDGFSFIKVDNQWVIRKLYTFPENIQTALQFSAYTEDLDIINCMSMVPECYTNYFISNVMRTSNDYIPNWKDAGKLHLLFNAYNSLFFSNIIYPDYDMFVTYDPYALAHLIMRIFSGGPVYITDKDPGKTNVELLNKVMISENLLTVDYPGLITKDIIFSNPFEEDKLLKIASKASGIPVVAAVNINKSGKRIIDSIKAGDLPYKIDGNTMYYKVIKGEHGYLNELSIDLGEMDAEIIVLAKKGTPIGLKEYLLPPSTIVDGVSLSSGTLIILDDEIKEIKVEKGYKTQQF